jgi:hypothetical protein
MLPTVTDDGNRPVSLRASNQDREKVAGILHAAAADGQLSMVEVDERLRATYRAVTLDDLRPLTRDLSTQPVSESPLPTAPSTETAPVRAWSVMSSIERRGRWVVPPNLEVSTVMGSAKLDLRQAVFVEPRVHITVNTLMGSATIVLPEDVEVDVDGFGFMGTFIGTAGQPTLAVRGAVRVTGFALMGSVTVRRANTRERARSALKRVAGGDRPQ